MSIQISWDHTLDQPEDPLDAERGGVAFSYAACYASWWSSERHKSSGRIRTAISSGGRYKLYAGHLETLRNLVTWARSQGLDMRLVRSLESNLGGRLYTVYPVYSLELQYTDDDPADKIFYGLNHCRFASSEFVRGKLPTKSSYRQLLTLIFQRTPEFYGHLPFTNPHDISGGWRSWGDRRDASTHPEFGPIMGKALYAFWSSLRERKWSGPKITGRYADRTSKISAGEWLAFYQLWYKTDDKDKNY